MSTVLDEIIVGVREDLAARVQQVPLEEMKKRALAAAPARDALASLRGEVPGGGNGTTARIISLQGCARRNPRPRRARRTL